MAALQQFVGINTVLYYAPTIMERTGLTAANSIVYPDPHYAGAGDRSNSQSLRRPADRQPAAARQRSSTAVLRGASAAPTTDPTIASAG